MAEVNIAYSAIRPDVFQGPTIVTASSPEKVTCAETELFYCVKGGNGVDSLAKEDSLLVSRVERKREKDRGMIMRRNIWYPAVITVMAALLMVYPAESKEISIAKRPESVTKGFGGDYYVTVMRSSEKSGDGGIQRIKGDKVADFATGLNEPKGIGFTGEFLVTTDVTKVWKIDAEGKKSLLAEKSDFPHEVRYLNDVAVAADNKSVFVSRVGPKVGFGSLMPRPGMPKCSGRDCTRQPISTLMKSRISSLCRTCVPVCSFSFL